MSLGIITDSLEPLLLDDVLSTKSCVPTQKLMAKKVYSVNISANKLVIRLQGYKTSFMLNSTEPEISTAHKN